MVDLPIPQRLPRRSGFTSLELLVSASLLIGIMTFATTLCFRINQLWREIAQNRIALCELSNQLESLTGMNPAQARQALNQLQPSELCTRSLPNAILRGELIEAGFPGPRIVLRLDWQRRFPAQPMELAGWLVTADPPSGNGSEP